MDEQLRRLRVPKRERRRVLDVLLFPLVFGAAIAALHFYTRR